jgi:hypothetical protein
MHFDDGFDHHRWTMLSDGCDADEIDSTTMMADIRIALRVAASVCQAVRVFAAKKSVQN